MNDNNPWNNDNYDPEAERCCKDCGKTFKTKEGVLHGKYDFHCSPCHIWWKKTYYKIYWGVGIFVVLVLVIGGWIIVKYLKDDDKPKKKKKRIKVGDHYIYEEEDEDDD